MKHLKLILTVCIAVCAAAFACMFAACNNTEDNKVEKATSLTVTVLLEEGTPAEGVFVGVCETGDNGKCLQAIITNANGVSVVDLTGSNELNGEKMEIHLTKVPDGYVYADANGTPYETDTLKPGNHGVQIPLSQSTLTITLKKAAA